MKWISKQQSKFLLMIFITHSHAAFAGGFGNGNLAIDPLFDPSKFAVQSSVTMVHSGRSIEGENKVSVTNVYPRVSLKAGLSSKTDCLLDIWKPWGGVVRRDEHWRGQPHVTESEIDSTGYGLLCGYKYTLDQAFFRLIGGVVYHEMSGFQEAIRFDPAILQARGSELSGMSRVEVTSGHGIGWRLGAAYEIPKFKLRASILYDSAVKINNATGTNDTTQVPQAVNPANRYLGKLTHIHGDVEVPQSVEVRLQSGINPNTMLFGSVKWTNWKEIESFLFCENDGGRCTSSRSDFVSALDFLYRDGMTITTGVNYQMTKQLGGTLAVSWDRGTSDGYGTSSDSWTVSSGLLYRPIPNIDFRMNGLISRLNGGNSGAVTTSEGRVVGLRDPYTFSSDYAYGGQLSLNLKW